MSRYWGFNKTGRSYVQRFGFTNNEWQNVLPKLRKSTKIGQDNDIYSYVILSAIAKN